MDRHGRRTEAQAAQSKREASSQAEKPEDGYHDDDRADDVDDAIHGMVLQYFPPQRNAGTGGEVAGPRRDFRRYDQSPELHHHPGRGRPSWQDEGNRLPAGPCHDGDEVARSRARSVAVPGGLLERLSEGAVQPAVPISKAPRVRFRSSVIEFHPMKGCLASLRSMVAHCVIYGFARNRSHGPEGVGAVVRVDAVAMGRTPSARSQQRRSRSSR